MTNAEIAQKFRLIRRLLQKTGEANKFRLMAYSRAASQIDLLDKELSEVLAEGEPAFHEFCGSLKHIGEKSRAKIMLLIRTGTCLEIDELEAAVPVTQDEFFAELPKAKRKASKNLREEVTATRRPLAQATEVVDKVVPVIQKYFNKHAVCGSYRRSKDTVKDIDIALTQIKEEWAHEDVEMLFTRIERDLGVKEENVVKRGKAQTAFYHPSSTGDWHVDFWYIPPESWGSAILFATGSADFNIEMRRWLKINGYKLNRYGLYKVTKENPKGELLAQQSEEDIFDALDLEWVPPSERNHFDPNRVRKVS